MFFVINILFDNLILDQLCVHQDTGTTPKQFPVEKPLSPCHATVVRARGESVDDGRSVSKSEQAPGAGVASGAG